MRKAPLPAASKMKGILLIAARIAHCVSV